MINPFSDEYFMKQAYVEAQKAYEKNEVPIGAVIVANQKIISRGHNLTETLNDVTSHAEMQAITAAADYLGGKYLIGCTLYVTMEPCVMCAGALYWSQIDKVVYAARDEKRGAMRCQDRLFHPKTVVVNGPMEHECSELVKSFFQKMRKF